MIAKIALEEAFNLPNLPRDNNQYTSPTGSADLAANLADIHDQRLKGMDENGIEYMVLSLTSPGPQDIIDPVAAQDLAKIANDYLAGEIRKNPDRFGGFGALSMHDPKSAALEARRAIKELGFHGLLVNDFQSTGNDGEGAIFYDQPEWDVFWKEVEELDVPLYIHPRLTTPAVTKLFLTGRPWLRGSTYFFRITLHVLGLYANGVFDRFPRLKIVIGHMGENIPFQLWRFDHRMSYYSNEPLPKAKRSLRETMKTNISITTSGHYGTPALLFAIRELGIDRVLFSIDYPYERIDQGPKWFDSITELSEEEKKQIAFGNAKRLLKLK
ncbi:uncharacterized protein TRUGW13939_02045 [Talaromyces rugulosus]|uniref:Amidohydrolase-related domain-containing protein n=1 Tax=Talaromyces rugulosus TaxID=121627 RepID=A0A7H8QNB6_TALRU|nr:uncharacterized protein TRUGW13939_02045 [Talaromyces rugulosus]QKX54955.1 hypothetical protein TRUGW13939_02045 [Talaromyces rugulosus]